MDRTTMRYFFAIFALAAAAAVATAHPASQEDVGVLAQAVRFVGSCGEQELTLCLKERALRFVDNMPSVLDISEGVKLKEVEGSRRGRQLSAPALPEEPRARESALDTLLMDRLTDFLGSHTIEFKIPEDTVQDVKRSLEEGRKKKKKMLLPLLLLLKLKAAALIPLALGAIALIAFKALAIGKLALLISAIIGIKKLLSGMKSSKTVEVVAHPHYSHSYDDHHSYGRSLQEAQNLAYSAHVAKSS